jgi:hypothetical protein
VIAHDHSLPAVDLRNERDEFLLGPVVTRAFRKEGGILRGVGLVFVGYLIVSEDSVIRAFRHAGTAVNALIGVNEVMIPLGIVSVTWHDALSGTDLHTGAVQLTKSSDYMGH